jgi:hypothetical protein
MPNPNAGTEVQRRVGRTFASIRADSLGLKQLDLSDILTAYSGEKITPTRISNVEQGYATLSKQYAELFCSYLEHEHPEVAKELMQDSDTMEAMRLLPEFPIAHHPNGSPGNHSHVPRSPAVARVGGKRSTDNVTPATADVTITLRIRIAVEVTQQ